jgi:rhodanese-related sulfurtransferase
MINPGKALRVLNGVLRARSRLLTILLAVLVCGLGSATVTPTRTMAAVQWSDSTFAVSAPITVSERSGVAPTDYQVNATLPYDSHMQSGFGDASSHELSNRPVTYSASGTGSFRVKVSSIASLPAVTTSNASNVSPVSATLNGSLSDLGSASSVSVSFEWGTTPAYGNSATASPARFKKKGGSFTADLSGLKANQTYYFRAKAVGDGTSYGGSIIFATTAPTVVAAGLSTSVTASSAVISGSLTSPGAATNINVSFEYGTTTAYGSNIGGIPATLNAPGTFTANVTGLAAGTLYHYRAKAVGNGTVYGTDAGFITCNTAQTARTLIQNNITNPNFVIIDVRTPAEYATGYIAGAINVDRYAADLQTRLQVLDRNKTHLVYCGSGLRSSQARDLMAGMGFQTLYTIVDGLITWKALGYPLVLPVVPPAVTTGTASNVAATTARVGGSLTATGNAASVTVSFEYGTTTGYGSTAAGMPATFTANTAGAFTANLGSLAPGTLYHFRAKAVGAATGYGGDATFTTTAAVVVPPPVYYDGGGGGYVAPPQPNVTVTGLVASGTLIVDSAGAVQDAVDLKTADGYVTITIAKGAQLLDGEGQALKAINAKPLLSPPSPPANGATLFAYSFDPSPALFRPSVTLTYRYDPQMVPAGIDPRQLYIAVWDGKAWQAIDSTVDPATTSVSARLTQFSQYALLAKLPPPPLTASFMFTAFTITPSVSYVGDAVAVSVTCANLGNGKGDLTVLLKVDSAQEDSKVIALDPGESQNVIFPVKRSVPGTYAVDVNGLRSQFTVQAAPVTTTPPPATPTLPAPTPPKTTGVSASWILIYVGLFALLAIGIGTTLLTRRKKQ